MNETKSPPTDPRIYMAAERTFLAWIRTGISLMGFGFVVARFGLFLRELAANSHPAVAPHENGFSLPAGIALIVAGILVNLRAAVRHRQYMKSLDQNELSLAHGTGFSFFMAGFLALIGVAVAVYLAFFL